jgi:hypothetical protein
VLNSTTLTYKPPIGAKLLVFVTCLLIAQPVAIVVGGIMTWSEHVSASVYLMSLMIVIPASMALAGWILSNESVQIASRFAVFAFTRYGLRRKRNIEYANISTAEFIDGLIGTDGRPRPLFVFTQESGEQCWVPLSIYTRQQVRDIVKALEARGVRFDPPLKL